MVVAFAAIALFLCFPGGVKLQEKKPAFQIELSKSSFVKFERILMRVSLTNDTDRKMFREVHIIDSATELLVTDEDGDETVWGGDNFRFFVGVAGFGPISPGSNLSQTYVFSGEAAMKYFPKAGKYEFRFRRTARFPDESKSITHVSNTVAFEVRDPVGLDLEAYNFLKKELRIRTSSNSLQQELAEKQEFVDRFGDSVYGNYYRLELARQYYRVGYEADAEREFLILEEKDTIYREEVEKQLAKLRIKSRRTTFIPHFKKQNEDKE